MFSKVFNRDAYNKLGLADKIYFSEYMEEIKKSINYEFQFWSEVAELKENEYLEYTPESPISEYMFTKILDIWKYKDSVKKLQPILLDNNVLAFTEDPNLVCEIMPEEQTKKINGDKKYFFILERKYKRKIHTFSKKSYFSDLEYRIYITIL